jgi:hypothetical protein
MEGINRKGTPEGAQESESSNPGVEKGGMIFLGICLVVAK